MPETDKPNNTRPRRKWLVGILATVVILLVAVAMYVWTHPLIFNESFFGHAHCMPQAGIALRQYARDHHGKFPAHTNGYGDALLLLLAEGHAVSGILTGPGYSGDVFDRAIASHADVPETECGRVYVQGLTDSNDEALAVLFDKLPTPGDHTHFLARIRHPLGREVCFLDGHFEFVSESRWPAFASNQMELLVKAGFIREKAQAIYADKGKAP